MTEYEQVGVVHYAEMIVPGVNGGVNHWQNGPTGWTLTRYTREEWTEAIEDD